MEVCGRRWIVEPAQLGENTDAEAGLGILGNVQVVEAGATYEIGRTAHSVVHDLAVLAVEDTGHATVIRLANLDAIDQLGKRFGSVAGNAEVGLHEFEDLLRHDAERRAAANDGCVGYGADPLDDTLGNWQLPLRVHVAVVAQVSDRDAHQFGLELGHHLLDLTEVIGIGEHQVDQFDLMARAVQMTGDIGKADWYGLGTHTAHNPIVAVGSNQQNTHLKTLPGVCKRPDCTPRKVYALMVAIQPGQISAMAAPKPESTEGM